MALKTLIPQKMPVDASQATALFAVVSTGFGFALNYFNVEKKLAAFNLPFNNMGGPGLIFALWYFLPLLKSPNLIIF